MPDASPTGSMNQFVKIEGLKRYFDVSAPWLVRAIEGRPRQIVQAVDGIDIEIAKGETFSLVGESGCGKSTVARLVVGLYPPTAGSIEFDGNDMAGPRSRADMAALRRRMQMIFQDPYASLNPRWRVFDIVAEPIRAFGLAKDKADLENQVGERLRQVRLTPADGTQVSARILRRPAPAHLDRPRAGEPPGVPGVRRAHLGARRLGAGPDPEPDGRPAAPPAAHLSVHQPQPRGRLSHLDARRRDVPRPPGRGGADRHAVQAPQAPLHADAAGHDPRPRHDRPPARAGGGRGAEPDQPADRLHLPSALPVRQRALQGRAAAGAAHRGRHGGVPRDRGRPACASRNGRTRESAA